MNHLYEADFNEFSKNKPETFRRWLDVELKNKSNIEFEKPKFIATNIPPKQIQQKQTLNDVGLSLNLKKK
ncbi:hypothetical protein SNEBB_003735 [Seison nebaliae]|nr:hypothetical protein SNEBB_003735 [Seison nebaliae]